MTDCEESTLVLLQPWVTWSLVILGWFFVHVTTSHRERRKEDAAILQDLEKRATELRDLAEKYFLSEVSERGNGVTVRNQLKSFASRLQLLRKRRPWGYDLTSEMIALRRALTFENFDTATGVPSAQTDPVVQRLWAVVDDVIAAMNLEFERANRSRYIFLHWFK